MLGNLANTQWYFVSSVSLVQIPIWISAGDSKQGIFHVQERRQDGCISFSGHINRHTLILASSLSLSPPLSLDLSLPHEPLSSHLSHVSRAPRTRHTLTHSAHSPDQIEALLCNCCSAVYCQVFVWIGGAFGAFTVTDRQSHHVSHSLLPACLSSIKVQSSIQRGDGKKHTISDGMRTVINRHKVRHK